MRGRLDQRITGQQVEPATETVWFKALARAGDLVDLRIAEPGRVEAVAQSIIDGCGPSRSRGRSASNGYALLLSLAARWLPAPPEVMPALAAALDVVPATIDPSVFVGDEDRLDGPSRAELVALQIIAAARAHGSSVVVRRAAYALVEWYQRERLRISLVVANAVGVVLGAVDPNRRVIADATFTHVLGTSYPSLFRRTAEQDFVLGSDASAESIAASPDTERAVRKWRGTESYRRVRTLQGRAHQRAASDRANEARHADLTLALHARDDAIAKGAPLPELPAATKLPCVDHDAVWARWNTQKPHTRRSH